MNASTCWRYVDSAKYFQSLSGKTEAKKNSDSIKGMKIKIKITVTELGIILKGLRCLYTNTQTLGYKLEIQVSTHGEKILYISFKQKWTKHKSEERLI